MRGIRKQQEGQWLVFDWDAGSELQGPLFKYSNPLKLKVWFSSFNLKIKITLPQACNWVILL